MKNYFKKIQEQTATRFWINNVTREEAVMAIAAGACGCTQNPAYTFKMIEAEERTYFDGKLMQILCAEVDDNEALVKMQRELVAKIAEIFYPIYEQSGGKHGYVSIQGDPLHEDAETIIRHVEYNSSAAPNLMAKIPVTKEGLKAMEVVLAEGIPVNATEVMSVRQALDVCRVYNKVTAGMKKPPVVYYSHITGILDEYLQKTVENQQIDVCSDILYQAGIAAAKKTYWMTREITKDVGFIGGGARGLQHFTEMVGADCVITINWRGTADKLIEQDKPIIQRFFMPTPDKVIDELSAKMPDFRKAYYVNEIEPEEYEGFGPVVLFRSSFENAWKKALTYIAGKRAEFSKSDSGR